MNEALVRLVVFLSGWALLAAAETLRPRDPLPLPRRLRWVANFGLVAIDTLVVRLLLPWLAIDAAAYAQAHEVGLLRCVPLPTGLQWILALVALDGLIYWQHRLMHLVPFLWRWHRVHHSDLVLDASSGVRFHPLEILFSMLIKIAAVLALGAPVGAVLSFELLLNAFSLFTHANLALPPRLDAALRWLVVTPDMHRVHHSIRREEHDRNFGFHLSVWDRLFGSYLERATTPVLGLADFRQARAQTLPALLLQPLTRPPANAVMAAQPVGQTPLGRKRIGQSR